MSGHHQPPCLHDCDYSVTWTCYYWLRNVACIPWYGHKNTSGAMVISPLVSLLLMGYFLTATELYPSGPLQWQSQDCPNENEATLKNISLPNTQTNTIVTPKSKVKICTYFTANSAQVQLLMEESYPLLICIAWYCTLSADIIDISGHIFNMKTVFPCKGIYIMKIRRSGNRSIVIMVISLLTRRRLYTETHAPGLLHILPLHHFSIHFSTLKEGILYRKTCL